MSDKINDGSKHTGVVHDKKDLDTTIQPDGMQANYLVLSNEERAKGFIRKVQRSYIHVGTRGPAHPTRDLTEDEAERYAGVGYAKFESYPKGSHGSATGRFWMQTELDAVGKGCGTRTTMGQAIAETYARNPHFYGATFCCGCGKHLPVGQRGEFVWDRSSDRVGT